jgi:hypothetical protein
MEFTRRKVRGRSKRVHREWFDTENLGYRIVWRREFVGVTVPPMFYACVRTIRPSDGFLWWNFCQHRRPYKTLKKAIEACERNRKVWLAFVELGEASGRRTERLNELDIKGRLGGGNILGTIPAWAMPLSDPTLIRMQFPAMKRQSEDECQDLNDRPAPTEASNNSAEVGSTSESVTPSDRTPDSGPVSSAVEKAGTTATRTGTSSKGTSSPRDTDAATAKTVKGQRKPSAKPTTPPSKRGKKSSPAISKTKRSGKRRSAS